MMDRDDSKTEELYPHSPRQQDDQEVVALASNCTGTSGSAAAGHCRLNTQLVVFDIILFASALFSCLYSGLEFPTITTAGFVLFAVMVVLCLDLRSRRNPVVSPPAAAAAAEKEAADLNHPKVRQIRRIIIAQVIFLAGGVICGVCGMVSYPELLRQHKGDDYRATIRGRDVGSPGTTTTSVTVWGECKISPEQRRTPSNNSLPAGSSHSTVSEPCGTFVSIFSCQDTYKRLLSFTRASFGTGIFSLCTAAALSVLSAVMWHQRLARWGDKLGTADKLGLGPVTHSTSDAINSTTEAMIASFFATLCFTLYWSLHLVMLIGVECRGETLSSLGWNVGPFFWCAVLASCFCFVAWVLSVVSCCIVQSFAVAEGGGTATSSGVLMSAGLNPESLV